MGARALTRISDLGRWNKDQGGFSLLELIVVITILSILTLGISLSVSGRSGAQSLEGDLAKFQRHFNDLRNLAIQGQRPRGLNFGAKGMRMASFDAAQGRWLMNTAPLPWAGSVVLVGVAPTDQPDIVILPDGRISAFELRFTFRDRTGACRIDGGQELACRIDG